MPEEADRSRFFDEGKKKREEKKEVDESKDEQEKKEIDETKNELEKKNTKNSPLQQRIYQTEGIIETLGRKFENDEIEEKKYKERTEKLRENLAELYEKKLKRKLRID